MTDFDYDDDDDQFIEPRPQDPNGPKALRAALKARDKELKELRDQFEQVQARERNRTVAGVLSKQGINSKVADFIPASVGADEEAVTKWVEQYADVFGVHNNSTEGSQGTGAAGTSTVPPEDQTAITRIANASATGIPPESNFAETMSALQNADADKVLEMVYAAQKGART